MRKQSEQGEWLTMWLERTGFCMGADGVGLHAHQGLQPHKGWELWEGNEPGGDKIRDQTQISEDLSGCWNENRWKGARLKGSSKMSLQRCGLWGEKWCHWGHI